MAREISSEERLYRICRDRAVEKYGRGWDRIGPQSQRDAIVTEVFFTIAAQDDSVAGDVVMRIVHHAQERIADEYPGTL